MNQPRVALALSKLGLVEHPSMSRTSQGSGHQEVAKMLHRYGCEGMGVRAPARRKRGETAATATSNSADRSMTREARQAGRGPNLWEMTMLSIPVVLMLLLFCRAGAGTALWVFVAARLTLRTSASAARLSNVRKTLAYTKTATALAFMGGVVALPTVGAGRCAFTQECFQSGVDTDCTPVPAKGDTAQSFPMDKAHGFDVAHDKVWDGSVEDPSTGLCQEGRPDADGRCMVDFEAPKGLKPVAPAICPQYKGDGCCTWQQNYALYQNLGTLVDSFGSSTGCLACAVNLVNFWCALICSPDQGAFATIHDPPFAQRSDDLTGGSGRVLQADVSVDADLACRIYDSCKSVAIVGETTAMQSGLGLLKFQMQIGAVGHGEFFFLSFANVGEDSSPEETHATLPLPLPLSGNMDESAPAPAADMGLDEGDGEASLSSPVSSSRSSALSFLSLETLACESFIDPGSSTIPFAYPPKKEGDEMSCTCDYCLAACSGGGSINVDVSDKNPIPVLDGFRFGLVGGVYAAVVACSLTLFWWRRSQHKRHRRAAAIWSWLQQQ